MKGKECQGGRISQNLPTGPAAGAISYVSGSVMKLLLVCCQSRAMHVGTCICAWLWISVMRDLAERGRWTICLR
jgi:uncharacterized membrane protein YdcZ (DUF606 family)